MSFNLATILTETTLAAPDAPACLIGGTPETTTTYRELDEQSGPAAHRCRKTSALPKGPSGKILKSALRNRPA